MPEPRSVAETSKELEVRLLGPLEVRRDGRSAPLPRSKKSRALFAYLVVGGRRYGREALCSLLWDTTLDPRGALRWSLSKLRKVVDGDVRRIEADRETVGFDARGAQVDVLELTSLVEEGVEQASTEDLERVAELARGEFVEGLELPDLFEFQAWCIAQRERLREARCAVLGELSARLREDPERALPFARDLVRADGFDVDARASLLGLLLDAGKVEEAEQHYALSRRLFAEMGVEGLTELDSRWRSAQSGRKRRQASPQAGERPKKETVTAPGEETFVGRGRECARLDELLDAVKRSGRQRVLVVSGEPGAGKSRLLSRIEASARAAGVAVLAGRAYEAEAARPFGPWVDALGADAVREIEGASGRETPATREGLFASFAERVIAEAGEHGALVVLDDLQWIDPDSAALLHFVVRTTRDQPLLVALLARSGELADNEPALRALRSIRRETRVESLELEPLSESEIRELVAGYEGVDVEAVHRASAGNPLYALELARAMGGETRASLHELVQERVDALPADAAEVMRWAAVLGHSVDVGRLRRLGILDDADLVAALERLEAHALLAACEEGKHVFAHDVVREAVYAGLSQPRRLLMHRQVARLLEGEMEDPAVAHEVARHAARSGDAALGVRACLAAGARCLRVFANGEAESLALRGLGMVEHLEQEERIAATLELLHLQYSARTPDREEASSKVQDLAAQALDLGLTQAARLGFQMLSFLRWESSSMADAHDNILQAERVSRSADPSERSAALAQAARCLVLLERNLTQAEAFVLEIESLLEQGGSTPSEALFAKAMLHEHRGELDEAASVFKESRWVGRQQGDRLAEFRAIEHWTMLEVDRDRLDSASVLASELVALGSKVREGAEGPCARALAALLAELGGTAAAAQNLEAAIEELRAVDAKYPLTFVLTRRARRALESEDADIVREWASEGLELATAIGRRSDVALAHALLLECARRGDDREAAGEHLQALRALESEEISALARDRLEAAIAAVHTIP